MHACIRFVWVCREWPPSPSILLTCRRKFVVAPFIKGKSVSLIKKSPHSTILATRNHTFTPKKNVGLGFGFGYGFHTQIHTQKPKMFGYETQTHTHKTPKNWVSYPYSNPKPKPRFFWVWMYARNLKNRMFVDVGNSKKNVRGPSIITNFDRNEIKNAIYLFYL